MTVTKTEEGRKKASGSGLYCLTFSYTSDKLPFMARPLRIEYSGAVYHIISRGNENKAIFKDDADTPPLNAR